MSFNLNLLSNVISTNISTITSLAPSYFKDEVYSVNSDKRISIDGRENGQTLKLLEEEGEDEEDEEEEEEEIHIRGINVKLTSLDNEKGKRKGMSSSIPVRSVANSVMSNRILNKSQNSAVTAAKAQRNERKRGVAKRGETVTEKKAKNSAEKKTKNAAEKPSQNSEVTAAKAQRSQRKREVAERDEIEDVIEHSFPEKRKIRKMKRDGAEDGSDASSLKGTPRSKLDVDGRKEAKKTPSKNNKTRGGSRHMVPVIPLTSDTVNTVAFKSSSTGETYLLPPSNVYRRLSRDPFISWCFKTGRWVDSRSDEHPCSSHKWSSALQNEMIDGYKEVVLKDKEVAMIERMLGGKKAEGYSAYKHLFETCNLEGSLIRAYIKLGKEVEGHPVSLVRCAIH